MWNAQSNQPSKFLAELYDFNCEEEEEDGLGVESGGEYEREEEEEELVKLEAEELEDPLEDDEEDEPSSAVLLPPFSPSKVEIEWRSRSRSRSPLVRVAPMSSPPSPSSPDQWSPLNAVRVVIRSKDEGGVNLEDRAQDGWLRDVVRRAEEDNVRGEHLGSGDGDFLTPDAHAMYVRMNERMETEESVNFDESGVIDDRGALDDRSERGMRARSVRGRARGVRGQGRRGRRGRGVGGGRRRREAEAWIVGQSLEEICVTDDDVPLELREMAMDVVRKRMRITEERSTSDRSTRERRTDEEKDASEIEDVVFEDAIDGSTHFEWSPMETFQIREAIFTPERTGSVTSFSSPYDAFRSYWDINILKTIVKETNRYASKIPSPSFQAEWYSTNSHEILCLFAFWMMLGILRMPTIASCFSTCYLFKTEIFRHIFTLKRYTNLVRALHFIDSDPSYNAASTSTNDMASSDPVNCLKPIIKHLNAKFQANYVPSQDICIDESLVLWKGRLSIKQYIRSKAARYGIKTYELCESTTGYLWSFIVYTGKYTDIVQPNSTDLKSTAVVKKLIAPLLNKGYRLFMDNWYNSPLLARFLKRNGTECIGTLRSSRQDVPSIIKNAPLRQGQFVARHAGDVCVLSWQDKNRVNMISTCHGAAVGLATIPSRPPPRPLAFKPQMVLDYNKSMGGVDRKDQMLEPYLLERKRGSKWYMKLFKRLLNVSILNALILLRSSQQQSVDHLDFRLLLVDAIIEKHLPRCPKTRSSSSHHTPTPAPHRLNHTHWPVSIPPSASRKATNRKGQLACFVCKSENRRKITTYKCETCDVPLCVENCFRIYHTSY